MVNVSPICTNKDFGVQQDFNFASISCKNNSSYHFCKQHALPNKCQKDHTFCACKQEHTIFKNYMRVSRTRFSKRRSKKKTSFPVIAVVQKKSKPYYGSSQSFTNGLSQSFNVTHKTPDNQKRFNELKRNQKQDKNVVPATQKARVSASAKKSRATIDYKNVVLLRKLITAEGKILPRRINKLTAKQQRYTAKAIKQARIMGLLPFINMIRPFK